MSKQDNSTNKSVRLFDMKKLYMERKLAVLEVVDHHKDILFASCSSNVAQQVKERAWGEVLAKAKAVHLVSDKRDWRYARDHLYNVWKAKTMTKMASLKTTETVRLPGGSLSVTTRKTRSLTEVDGKILDIVCTSPKSQCWGHQPREVNGRVRNSYSWSRVSEDDPRRSLDSAVERTYLIKRQMLHLQLLKHEVYIRKMRILRLEKEAGYELDDPRRVELSDDDGDGQF